MNPSRSAFIGFLGAMTLIGISAFFILVSGVSPVSIQNSQSASVLEVSDLRLDFGRQLSASNCNGQGSPVINASQKIINTIDSGEAGNYWGYDDINRIIQVWKTSTPDTYCAVVKYEGRFRGVKDETSPGATGILTGKESGPFQGGYSATITGTLLNQSLWNNKGGVGTTDYNCDVETGDCPGAINWVTQYFDSNYTFTYQWWGWIYRAGGKKVWVNSSDGNSGDII